MNLKQKLCKKLKKSGGFTLIEMLIVVAIIAILVAVSIPLVSNSLNKARKSTDAANERAAKAAAVATYLADNETGTVTYYYDAVKGEVTEKTTDATAPAGYGQCSDHKGGYVTVTITNGASATMVWYKGSTAMTGDGEKLDSTGLITGTDSSTTTPSAGGSGEEDK